MSNADEPQDTQPSDVRIRRAPKVATFLILGGGLGAIITFILTAIFPVDPNVGFGALFGYFSLFGVTAGVVVGAIFAIVLDRRADRNARTVTAVIERTESPSGQQAAQPETPAQSEQYEQVDTVEGADSAGKVDVPEPTAPPTPPARPAAAPIFDQDDDTTNEPRS